MQSDRSAPRPRMGRIHAAIAYSGISRSGLYLKSKKYRGLLRKDGNTTLVDFDVLDLLLDDLPSAEIGSVAAATAEVARSAMSVTNPKPGTGDPGLRRTLALATTDAQGSATNRPVPEAPRDLATALAAARARDAQARPRLFGRRK